MATVSENLTSIVWKNPEFLAYFGALTPENVLNYFAESPFWDRQSTNQTYRMQTQFAVPQGSYDEADALKKFVGVEFALVHSVPPHLFVIQKRQRMSPTNTQPIASYYVLNENVYQAPNLYEVLSARLLTAIHAFRSSFDLVKAKAPAFDPRRGHQFRIVEPSQDQLAASAAPTDPEPSEAPTPVDPLAAGEKKPESQTKRQALLDSYAMQRAFNTTMADFFPA